MKFLTSLKSPTALHLQPLCFPLKTGFFLSTDRCSYLSVWAGLSPASPSKGYIRVFGYIPVMDRACKLSSCWIVYSWFLWFFHQSPAPYNAVDWTTAIWILRTISDANPQVRVNPLIWNFDVRALSIRSLTCEVDLSWLLSLTPYYRVASLLNVICSLPILILSCAVAYSIADAEILRITQLLFLTCHMFLHSVRPTLLSFLLLLQEFSLFLLQNFLTQWILGHQ